MRNYLLRGKSQIALYSKFMSDVAITFSALTMADDWVRYFIRDSAGGIVAKGNITGGTTVHYKAKAGEVYFLDVSASSARYQIEVSGASFAINARMQENGLHFYRSITPLYFYVDKHIDEFTVSIVTTKWGRSIATDLISPDGDIAASLDTKNSFIDSARIKVKEPKSGFWALTWKHLQFGAQDDIWINLDKNIEQWIMLDSENLFVIETIKQ